ncbi:MAG TPA: retroviral-like aspartic protease family protein [Dehalococcoidia bacterium]|nr:retroviral-like aspartic protease family protein [Dehalococcoidia bacterium]
MPIKLANPNQIDDKVDVPKALVDTGATWTAVPRQLARQLGLQVVGKMKLKTAAGSQEFDQSFAYLEMQGKSMVTPVVIADLYDGVLIGVTTLESLGFAVDPTSQTLVDAEILLL